MKSEKCHTTVSSSESENKCQEDSTKRYAGVYQPPQQSGEARLKLS